MRVSLPKRFEGEGLFRLFEELRGVRDSPDVDVDFSTLTYSKPTGMLVAGSELRKWVSWRHSQGYYTTASGIDPGVTVHSYLMHMGFFDFIYMNQGKKVGEARGSSKYLPITVIRRPNVDLAQLGVAAWYESIEEEARKLAGVLAGSFDDSDKLRAYTYSIREIIRNVFEHSGVGECFFCGQRWWNGEVEIAVVDEGRGISSSLRESFKIASDADALRCAIRPGISRTSRLDVGDNVYENSGFGLYVLSEIGANFGWFALGSGEAKLVAFNRKSECADFGFNGTFIGLHLNKSPSNFRGLLSDIISAGEEEAKLEGREAAASARSKIS